MASPEESPTSPPKSQPSLKSRPSEAKLARLSTVLGGDDSIVFAEAATSEIGLLNAPEQE